VICACDLIKSHKFSECIVSLFISFKIYFLIFFVFRHWKCKAWWLSLIEGDITKDFVEFRFSINDFNFKREGGLLIQWIGDVADNFKLPRMSYGLELINILWKGTERRQFCVLDSHRKHLKIKISWHCVGWDLIHLYLLIFRGSECKNRWAIDYLQLNGFARLP
jgi:hypothetical protein